MPVEFLRIRTASPVAVHGARLCIEPAAEATASWRAVADATPPPLVRDATASPSKDLRGARCNYGLAARFLRTTRAQNLSTGWAAAQTMKVLVSFTALYFTHEVSS